MRVCWAGSGGPASLLSSSPSYQLQAVQIFRLFPHDSFVGRMFLGLYPFLPGYPVCWHVIVHCILLTIFSISVASVVTSPFSFLILVIWDFSLFFGCSFLFFVPSLFLV